MTISLDMLYYYSFYINVYLLFSYTAQLFFNSDLLLFARREERGRETEREGRIIVIPRSIDPYK